MSVRDITSRVSSQLGPTPDSSIRSYLRLNTPQLFERRVRGLYSLQRGPEAFELPSKTHLGPMSRVYIGKATLFRDDCFDWLERQAENTIHAVVTDPPYGLYEYSADQQEKLRRGKGGVWRIP